MGDNIIYDSNTDTTIGFYNDLVKFYNGEIRNYVETGEYEEAKSLLEELEEIEEHANFEGLLVLSENNGMGFTCRPYAQKPSDSGENN